MKLAVGLLEFRNITRGIAAADAMCKAANVDIVFAQAVCIGKYIVMVTGDVGAVQNAVQSGKRVGGSEQLIDSLVLSNLHDNVFTALKGRSKRDTLEALGVIESRSVASAIIAADAAAKAARVEILEVRLARFMGGKAVVTLTGDVAAVKVAVQSGCQVIGDKLVDQLVLPSPHKNLGTLVF